MALNILLALVIGGIASIAVLLHLMGKSRRRMMDVEDARAGWHRQFPDDLIEDAVVSRDGHAAIISTEQGPGLVWAHGADTAARRLRDFDIVSDADQITILFHDYTAPSVTLHLTESEQTLWQSLMRPE